MNSHPEGEAFALLRWVMDPERVVTNALADQDAGGRSSDKEAVMWGREDPRSYAARCRS